MVRKISFFVLLTGLSLGSGLSPRSTFARQIRVSQNLKALASPLEEKSSKEKKKTKPDPPELTGKYLVGEPISIRALCAPPPPAIKLSLCSGGTNQAECIALDRPPSINSIFHLKGTDDSGHAVRIQARVVSGKADVYPYDDARAAVRVRPKDGGKLVLEVTAQANAIGQHLAAGSAPLRLILHIAGSSGSDLSSCARLLPPVIQKPPVIESSMIIGLIGTPQPYFLEAPTKDKILIYSIYPPQDKSKTIRLQILEAIKHQIEKLSRFNPDELGLQTSSRFTVEVSVPHAAELGDLGARIASLNNSKFTATRVGGDRIRITSSEQPDCETWSGYLANLQHLIWKISPESPTARLFYLDAGDVSKVLGSGGGQTAQSASPPAGGAPSGTPATAQASPTGTATPGQTAAPSAGGSPTPTTKADSPPVSKTTASVLPLKEDLLVFNDSNPGDDADITEKKRIIALLDLPRPEMIVNAWVMQNSSKDAKLVTGFSDTVARTVSAFNNALEASVSRAWSYLSNRVSTPENYFEDSFYRYISLRYIGELPYRGGFPISPSQGAQEVLELRSDEKFPDPLRERYRACGADEYCLGYSSLFNPLKPRLTDLLIAVIAARSPIDEARAAITAMETPGANRSGCLSGADHPDYCEKLRSRLRIPDPASAKVSEDDDCRKRDLIEIHKSARYDSSPILHLRCFGDKAKTIFGRDTTTKSQVGLLRAAIADFLFNYKMSQQYPHEFSPYDLSQSADTLNAALSPFIEGFNQDLKAFQEFLQEDLRYRVETLPGAGGWFFSGGKQSFINNGIVSVRTISGKPSTVDTTSQSFLDASSLPQFADLAKAILDQSPAKGANGDPTGVLGNVSFNQAQVILGALEAFKPTTVQIGRALNLKIGPRSLSAASAAEIDVTLNADESAPPTYYGGPKGAQAPNTSLVAKHDTTTRVRVDSIKLFEVSSFSAELQRSRSRFPLLPPFVEIPYVGTLIGIPLPPAKQYHTSTAVLSAVVVPTAADLAYGLSFTSDRILDPYGPRRALSLKDLYQPVRSFNKEKINCLAALQGAAAWCPRLSFSDVLREPNERRDPNER